MKTKVNDLKVPEFSTYQEEADFWDNLDTADYMPDDNEWIHFDTPNQRALRIAVLPEIVLRLYDEAHIRGVSLETLVNIVLSNHVHSHAETSGSLN